MEKGIAYRGTSFRMMFMSLYILSTLLLLLCGQLLLLCFFLGERAGHVSKKLNNVIKCSTNYLVK